MKSCMFRIRHYTVLPIMLLLFVGSLLPLSANAAGAMEQLIGSFHAVWATSEAGEDGKPQLFIVDADGNWVDLDVPAAVIRARGGLNTLLRQKVRVIGAHAVGPNARFMVSSIEVLAAGGPGGGEAAAASVPVTGSQAYITLMCRFGDATKYTPERLRFFQGLYNGGKPFPSLDNYWQEVSGGQVNLAGSETTGWYNLPQPLSYYYDDTTGTVYLNRMMDDCTAEADADVNFPDFVGINLVFNGDIGCCAWGGNAGLTLDGVTKTYGATWMPEWAWRSHRTPAHEVGHSFSLPHSSGPYGSVYDSVWDVMSGGGMPNAMDGTYGRLGNHTISYHKDMLGWIPAGQKAIIGSGNSQTIYIERTALPTDGGTAYLMAEIPKPDGTFYTVESRNYAGYEGFYTYSNNIPEEGILLHDVDPLRAIPAQVVDPDGVAPVTYAALGVGESWNDATNNITVDVNSASGTGFTVTITNGNVVAKADLVTTVVSGPASIDPSANITVSSTVTNQGDADAGAFEVGIYLSTDATIDASDAYLGSRSVTVLAQGGNDSGDAVVTIPGSTAPGQYWLGAIADDTALVDESNETNNTLAGNAINVNSPSGGVPPTEQWASRYDASGANDEAADIDVVNGVAFVGGSSTSTNDWNIDVVAYGTTDGAELYVGSYDSREYDLTAAVAGDVSGNGYAAGHSFEADYTSNTATVKFNNAGRKKFASNYGVSGVNDRGRDVAVDSAGNVYMTGYTGSDYITVKYNDRGVEQWASVYDSGGNDTAGHIVVDGAGNVYVSGNAGGNLVTVGYDNSGNQLWTQSITGASSADMILGNDGNLYVAGSLIGNLVTQAISPAGAELWQTSYDGGVAESAVALAEDGSNVYVSGTAQNANNDYITVAFSIVSGTQQWATTYDGGTTDNAAGIAVDAEGIYVTGTSGGNYVTVGYDTAGTEQWTLAYDNGGSDIAAAIAVDGVGGIYVTGKSAGTGTGNDFATVKYAR